MKRAINLVLLSLLIVSGSYAQLFSKTLATVRLTETEVITENDIVPQIELLEAQLGQTLTSSQKDELLMGKVNTILLLQAARREGVSVTQSELDNAVDQQRQSLAPQLSIEQFRQAVTAQGSDWNEFVEQVENRLIQQKYIQVVRPNIAESVPMPTEQEINQTYAENAAQFVSPAMSRFDHIFIETRNLASQERTSARNRMNEFYRRIRSGGLSEFNSIKNASLDDPSYSGGDFGYVIQGLPQSEQLLGRSFLNAVYALESDAISEVIESNIGLHIIHITDKRAPRLLELNDPLLPGQNMTVRQQITEYIRAQKSQEMLADVLLSIVDELSEEADIRIFDENKSW